MLAELFVLLEGFENLLWEYIGIPVIFILSIVLTVRSRFFLIRRFPQIAKLFWHCSTRPMSGDGIHPLKAFFTCVGGCIGIGNIVGICTAVQIGGPGALFWVWVTAICGAMMKYSEVYLGIRHRQSNDKGQYHGGPMYFLQKATRWRWVPGLVAILICVYGVEVYQFSVVVESVSINFGLNKFLVSMTLLGLVLAAVSGGIRRVSTISSIIVPVFVLAYLGAGSWILWQHLDTIPLVLKEVFVQAFSPSSAAGGLAGGSIALTMSQGVRRGCYTGDLGIGYASIVHSSSSGLSAVEQASLTVFDIILDTFVICTVSIMLILVTGVWREPITPELLVQSAFSAHFTGMEIIMPIFLALVGFSTVITYFCVGTTCARYVSPRYGTGTFYLYAVLALASCCFIDTAQAQTLMAIAGGLLLLINGAGIFCLRKEIIDQINTRLPVSRDSDHSLKEIKEF